MASHDIQRPIRIRTRRTDDREFILSLAARLAAVGSPTWRDPEQMRAFHEQYAEAVINADGASEAVGIAEGESGQRLGVVHVLDAIDSLTHERQGYIATLAVVEGSEGRGVGSALMQWTENWCRERGHRIVALDVFAANPRARAFYDRLGCIDETLRMIKEL